MDKVVKREKFAKAIATDDDTSRRSVADTLDYESIGPLCSPDLLHMSARVLMRWRHLLVRVSQWSKRRMPGRGWMGTSPPSL